MWTFAAGLIGLLSAAASALAGQTYLDPKYAFSVTFPDGWLVTAESALGGSVAGILNEPRTVCAVSVVANEATQGSAQAELDAEMRQPFGLDFWREQSTGTAGSATVETHGVREHPSGRPVQEAVLSEPQSPGASARQTSQITILATPGLVHVVLCMTASADFAAMKPGMTGVAESYRPGPERPLAVALTGGSSATSVRPAAGSAAKNARDRASKAWTR